MKIHCLKTPATRSDRIRRHQAMTLMETMTAVGIFGMVTMALAYAFMFGMRVDQLTQSKLGASDQSRRGFNQMSAEIRGAKIWEVGNAGITNSGMMTNFIEIPVGTAQQGTALKLSLTTDTNTYICYYFQTNWGKLVRYHTGQTNFTVIAKDLTNNAFTTNTMYFTNLKFNGQTNTTRTHKGVVSVLLQFSQYQYPLTHVGVGFYFNYYRLSFKLTPHVPDGP